MKALEDFLRPTQEELFAALRRMYKGRSTACRGGYILVHGEAPVISQQEAYARLQAGRFSRREAYSFGETAPGEVHVTACALEYLTDSKGFRQPVYYFTLSDENNEALRGGAGWRTFVPALA